MVTITGKGDNPRSTVYESLSGELSKLYRTQKFWLLGMIHREGFHHPAIVVRHCPSKSSRKVLEFQASSTCVFHQTRDKTPLVRGFHVSMAHSVSTLGGPQKLWTNIDLHIFLSKLHQNGPCPGHLESFWCNVTPFCSASLVEAMKITTFWDSN